MAEYGIIFDMDGVLVDSYEAHYVTWRDMAAERGLNVTREAFDKTFGRTARETILYHWPEHALDEAAILSMADRKRELYGQLIDASFPAMDGARTLLTSLGGGPFKLAIGSSGPEANVRATETHFSDVVTFDTTVHAEEVANGKPDPEVFLTAAEKMGLSPERCIVIEDSVPGIGAARNAGMQCVGLVSTGHTREELAEADLVVDHFDELAPDMLLSLLEGK